MRMLCTIYKSPKEAEMYLYVSQQEGLSRVPEQLLTRFGKPQLVVTLPVSPERKLARAEATNVLASIKQNGYYLQLPPVKETYMQQINQHNHKLGGQ